MDPYHQYHPLIGAAGHERVAYGRRGGGGIWGEHPVCGGSEANAPRPPPPAEASTGVDGHPGVGRQRDGLVGSSAAAVRTLGWRRPDKGTPPSKRHARLFSALCRRLRSHHGTRSCDPALRSKYTTNAGNGRFGHKNGHAAPYNELISPDWCPNFVAGVISTEDLRPIPPL